MKQNQPSTNTKPNRPNVASNRMQKGSEDPPLNNTTDLKPLRKMGPWIPMRIQGVKVLTSLGLGHQSRLRNNSFQSLNF